MLHLKASILYLQLRRSREAKEAIGKRREQIHDHLGHLAEICMLQLLHRLKVKRVGLNPISKRGATGVWKGFVEENMFQGL